MGSGSRFQTGRARYASTGSSALIGMHTGPMQINGMEQEEAAAAERAASAFGGSRRSARRK